MQAADEVASVRAEVAAAQDAAIAKAVESAKAAALDARPGSWHPKQHAGASLPINAYHFCMVADTVRNGVGGERPD